MTSSLRDSTDSAKVSLVAHVAGVARCLWVDLTREAGTALAGKLDSALDLLRLRDPAHIPEAIRSHSPRFICFEFDLPDAPGLVALAHTRRHHPKLPVLMLTGFHSEAVALWALRLRVWDVLVKPVAGAQLMRHLAALAKATRQPGAEPGIESAMVLPPLPAVPPRPPLPLSSLLPGATLARVVHHGAGDPARTQAATDHVAAQFFDRITLDHVAALCRLSPSHFCHVFRQEQGKSFGQYLLRYRIERACESLAHPGALAKEVAYSVGFNDLSYFTWAFKRQVGVCPSRYHAAHAAYVFQPDPAIEAGAGSS